ncbi:MAG: type II secretion system protein [Candidatus Liptonbacteria bacterium]
MKIKSSKGFTLIEMLIVIAVIGILASLVLVGLGPVQKRGRDARRISDLRQVQNALELYFSKEGHYPDATTYSELDTDISTAGIGVSKLPHDPNWRVGSTSEDYVYRASGDQKSYTLGATLEDAVNPVLNDDIDAGDAAANGLDCGDANKPIYCVSL